jgi:hypothetical protein
MTLASAIALWERKNELARSSRVFFAMKSWPAKIRSKGSAALASLGE